MGFEDSNSTLFLSSSIDFSKRNELKISSSVSSTVQSVVSPLIDITTLIPDSSETYMEPSSFELRLDWRSKSDQVCSLSCAGSRFQNSGS